MPSHSAQTCRKHHVGGFCINIDEMHNKQIPAASMMQAEQKGDSGVMWLLFFTRGTSLQASTQKLRHKHFQCCKINITKEENVGSYWVYTLLMAYR